MELRESVGVAWEGLVANKMRGILTMLGVIIGVAAVISMLAIAGGARERMMGTIQQMGTNVLIIMSGQSRTGAVMGGFGSSQTLTLEDSDTIPLKCPSVLKSAPEVRQNAQVKYADQNTNTTIIGTNPDYLSVRNYKVDEGKFFTDKDLHGSTKVAVLGPTTAENLFGDESPLGKTIRIKGIPFQVIGLMAVKGAAGSFGDPDDQVYIPVTTAMRRVFGTLYVRTISVEARTLELMDQATSEVEDLLAKRHHIPEGGDYDFVIRSQADIIEMANTAAGIFTTLLAGIASVSLLVGGIGIMNIMLVSVTERTREIGIRIALGARRRNIQTQFLVEAMVLSLLGGVIGIILGVAGSWIIGHMSQWTISVSLSSILLSFGFAALVGIFFGFYPARKASRLDPIVALRYE